MTMKSLGLAAIALGCLMGIAVAQNTAAPPKPAPPTPKLEKALKALAEQHAATAKTAGAPANGSKADIKNPTSITLGWNIAHATNCGWFQTGLVLPFFHWFYVATQEGPVVYSVNDKIQAGALSVACANGNFFGWHVIDASTGAYDQTISYPFK